jgi:hypothetical protein
MFAHAKQSVTVIGYAVYQGQKVFEALAQRMDSKPELQVELFLNISRGDGDPLREDGLSIGDHASPTIGGKHARTLA